MHELDLMAEAWFATILGLAQSVYNPDSDPWAPARRPMCAPGSGAALEQPCPFSLFLCPP